MGRYVYQNYFTDRSGNVIDAANVSIYNANSTVLATVYSSSGSGTAISNSVVTTGVDGFFSFWVDTADYGPGQRFKFTPAKTNFTSRTYDDVVVFPDSIDVDYYSSFAAAVTAIGSAETTLYVRSNETVSTAVTVPSTLHVVVEGAGKFTKSGSGAITFNGPLDAPLKQIFSGFAAGDITGLKYVYPQWFGAKFDDSTDDSTAWANAIAAISAGEVRFTAGGTTRIGTGLTFPAGKVLHGEGMRASKMTYTGISGYALTFGSTSASALSYGTGARDFQLNLSQNGGNGIRLAGTADAYLQNIYLEGIPNTNTSTGIWIDGAVAANLFSTLINININHTKFGLDLSSSGVGQTTSVLALNAEVFCDLIAGSIGINVVSANGHGTRIIGGNLENCATGFKTNATGTSVVGLRFENNTTDLLLDTSARSNTFIGCIDLKTITDNAVDKSNAFLGNQNTSTPDQTVNYLSQLFLYGNLTIQKLAGGSRYVIFNDTTTGDLRIQAGPGSTALGGAINLRGSSYTGDSGGVIVGLGGTGVRKFRVNDAGFGDGTDLFTIDESGIKTETNYTEIIEIADPAAPAANKARFYVRDNGAGKTQLVVRFPTGAIQVIATEP